VKPEARLRARIRMLLDSHLTGSVWWSAIEHGRAHAGTAKQRAREWQRLAGQGVKTGIADLMFQAPGFTLWVELKAGANKPSVAQETFAAAQRAIQNGYEVVRSVEGLGEALERHGISVRPGWRVAAQIHDAALDVPPKPPKQGRTTGRTTRKPTLAQVKRGNAAALVGVRR
jgi:hypothetical protein